MGKKQPVLFEKLILKILMIIPILIIIEPEKLLGLFLCFIYPIVYLFVISSSNK